MGNPYLDGKDILMNIINPKFSVTVYQDSKKEWRWNIKSNGNHKIIDASSEGFESKQNCLNNLKLLQEALTKAISQE